MPIDGFNAELVRLHSPAESADAITPSDADNLPNFTRAIYVGTAGNLRVEMVGGQTVTFSNLQGGVLYPIRVRKVFATDTTAGALLGLR